MSLKRREIYKCSECPAVIDVVVDCDCGDDCTVQCCGKPMQKMDEKTADFKTEKHVPVVEKVEGGYLVKVGSVPHPMEEKHYIQMIELGVEGRFCRVFLKPGDKPEAFFPTSDKCCCEKTCGTPVARELCNVHGLWTDRK